MNLANFQQEDLDFIQDARAELRERASAGGGVLLISIVALLTTFILWAAMAELDEVTRGVGRVIPTQAVQTIQNLEGGIVKELRVSEGQKVEEGQILIILDDTASNATFQESVAQRDGMEASLARLVAEANNKPNITFSPRIIEERPDLIQLENLLFTKRRTELLEQLRLTQKKLSLANDRMQIIKPLVERRAHPRLEMLELESEIVDHESKLRDLTGGFQQKALEAYNQEKTRLEALNNLMEGRQDRVTRALVRSPVSGTVNKVHIKTVGGVVGPAEPIVDIVPQTDTLTVEADIRPADIAFLRPGHKATVKFTAYDFSIYGGLDGEVETISADTIQNDIDGQHYYRVKVHIDDGKLVKAGEELPIIPGMVTEVNVLTGRRTVLQYLLKPFHRARFNAMKER